MQLAFYTFLYNKKVFARFMLEELGQPGAMSLKEFATASGTALGHSRAADAILACAPH